MTTTDVPPLQVAPRYRRDDGAYVFRVPSDKVIAFAKSPHESTTFRR